MLDNTAINGPHTHAADLAQALAEVDAFIDAAYQAGRPVLVIDDGGLIAQGYGRPDAPRRIDAALELTVSGLKRIAAAGPLAIPAGNLARSAVKTRLGYPEIADAYVRRLRALLPAIKTIGRSVLMLGYGTLGSRLAAALHAHGCQLHVVDPDPLVLIAATEAGHATYRTAAHALRASRSSSPVPPATAAPSRKRSSRYCPTAPSWRRSPPPTSPSTTYDWFRSSKAVPGNPQPSDWFAFSNFSQRPETPPRPPAPYAIELTGKEAATRYVSTKIYLG